MRHFMRAWVIVCIFLFGSNLYGRAGDDLHLIGVREIPVERLPDLAISAFDARGPVIYFNPTIAALAGSEITAFIRAHEYGHIQLNHIRPTMFDLNPYFHLARQRENEIAADRFATDYWMEHNPHVVDVVIA